MGANVLESPLIRHEVIQHIPLDFQNKAVNNTSIKLLKKRSLTAAVND